MGGKTEKGCLRSGRGKRRSAALVTLWMTLFAVWFGAIGVPLRAETVGSTSEAASASPTEGNGETSTTAGSSSATAGSTSATSVGATSTAGTDHEVPGLRIDMDSVQIDQSPLKPAPEVNEFSRSHLQHTVYVKWKAESGTTVRRAGESVKIIIPKEMRPNLRFSQAASYPVMNPADANEQIGEATFREGAEDKVEVTITLNEKAVGLANIRGTLEYTTTFLEEMTPGKEYQARILFVNPNASTGYDYRFRVGEVPYVDYRVQKAGVDYDVHIKDGRAYFDWIRWGAVINGSGGCKESKLEDSLGEGAVLRLDSTGSLLYQMGVLHAGEKQDGDLVYHDPVNDKDMYFTPLDDASAKKMVTDMTIRDPQHFSMEFSLPEDRPYIVLYYTDIIKAFGDVSSVSNNVYFTDKASGRIDTYFGNVSTGSASATVTGDKGYVLIRKTDAAGKPLSYVEFRLTCKTGTEEEAFVALLRTNEDGYAYQSHLLIPGRRYFLEETIAPPKYKKLEKFEIAVKPESKEMEAAWKNKDGKTLAAAATQVINREASEPTATTSTTQPTATTSTTQPTATTSTTQPTATTGTTQPTATTSTTQPTATTSTTQPTATTSTTQPTATTSTTQPTVTTGTTQPTETTSATTAPSETTLPLPVTSVSSTPTAGGSETDTSNLSSSSASVSSTSRASSPSGEKLSRTGEAEHGIWILSFLVAGAILLEMRRRQKN